MSEFTPRPLLDAGAATAKRTIGHRLEDGLNRSNPFSLFATSLILGMLVLFLSIFVDIDDVVITHHGITKQVGIFYTPNWTIVYLVLFPLYLVMLSRQASYVRAALEELAGNACIITDDGERIDKEAVVSYLRDDFSSASNALLLLAAVTTVVALGGWYTSCYLPLHSWSIGTQAVGWGTAAIEDLTRKPDQTSLILYTFLAYCWMGAALFVYIACLFANLIYAAFFHKLANGQLSIGTRKIRLVSRDPLPKFLSEYLYNFLISCLLGFVAAFLMQLESRYLFSDKSTISQFWFGDIDVVEGWKTAIFQKIALPDAHFQADGAKDQTLFTSLAVLAATLVALIAGVWFIQATLRAARAYTASIAPKTAFLEKIDMKISKADIDQLESRDELSKVFPTLRTSATLCGGVIFCTLFPRLGILFSSIIFVGIWRYLANRLSKVTHVE